MVSSKGIVQKVRSYCAICGSGCPTVCHVKDGVLVKVTADKEHPGYVPLCPKGLVAPELVYSPQRLKYPMRRTTPKGSPDPGWERISWEQALDITTARLKEIKAEHGAEAVAFYRAGSSGSPMGEMQEWLIRLARAFGSPNTISTTHVCQWHRDHGSKYTYGSGMPPPEFEKSSLILLWGNNPTASSRPHVTRINKALAGGARLIVVDPRRIELAAKADLWLPLRPGTDGALLLGLLNVMLEENLFDQAFARDWTTAPFLIRSDTRDFLRAGDLKPGASEQSYVAWDASQGRAVSYDPAAQSFAAACSPALAGAYRVTLAGGVEVECKTSFQLLKELAAQYPPQKAAAITEVPEDKIRQAGRLIGTTKPACYYSFLGIEQTTNAMQSNRALCILYALTGNLETPGGNAAPARVPLNGIEGSEFLSREVLARRLGTPQRPLGPAATVGSIQAYEAYRATLTGKPYEVKGLFSLGGNLISANGDSLMGRDALRKLDFYAQAELFLTPAAELADIVLPAASYPETWYVRPGFGQSGNAKYCVQLRPQVVPLQHECWPDMKIVFEMARRLGIGDKFWNGDIEAALNYHIAPTGLTVDELRQHPGGIPLSPRLEYKKYGANESKTGRPRGFNTPSKRIEIYSQVFKDHGYAPLPVYQEPAVSPLSTPGLAKKYPLMLICAKLVQFCHGQHRALPSLRKAVPHPFLEINPRKAKELDIKNGEWVMLETPLGSIKVMARLTDKVGYNVVCSQHGWWQSCPELGLPGYDPYSAEGANINLLFSSQMIDPVSGSQLYKGFLCNVKKA